MKRNPQLWRARLLPLFLFCLVLALAVSAPAAERVVVPAPPGGGEGTSIAPEDMAIPFSGDPQISRQDRLRRQAEAALAEQLPAGKSLRYDDIGGNDVLIGTYEYLHEASLDIALGGDIYVAFEVYDSTSSLEIHVMRSQDGGASWELWGLLSDPDSFDYYFDPCVHVAEGAVNKCFVAFGKNTGGTNRWEIRVVGSDLSLPTADFSTEVVAMTEYAVWLSEPDLTSDAVSYGSFFLYLVAQAEDNNGGDIWFTRSTDQGTSFEAAYEIGSLAVSDREYVHPDVGYGFGGHVHVAWHFHSRTDAFDDALRYRRADSFANGGLAAWGSIQYLTTNANGYYESYPQIAASPYSNEVAIAIQRRELFAKSYILLDPGVFGSNDQGTSFPQSVVIANGISYVDFLELQTSTDQWVLGGVELSSAAIQRANTADITAWDSVQYFGDRDYWTGSLYRSGLGLDPSRSYRAAQAWPVVQSSDTDSLMFDAEWRGDPGYPNMENGFPVNLGALSKSPPAVVDLDGDGDLEIVFSDTNDNLQVFHHDGTILSGWPVNVGTVLSTSPVAIGDLEGNGNLRIVCGTNDGRVFAYDTAGNIAPGDWPFATIDGEPAFVSIGSLGGMYPRLVAVCSGDKLEFVDYAGRRASGTGWFGFPWGDTFTEPVAIGDVDGDGDSEAVGCIGNRVFAVSAESGTVFASAVPSIVSDAVTLGDLDLNGDVEIVIPTEDGDLYVKDGDGSPFPGAWPFSTGSGYRLTSAAIGDMLGGDEPEIAFASQDSTVYLLYHNGTQQAGYPVNTGSGWWIYGAPAIERVDGTSSDVVIGSRDKNGWAWNNFGNVITGWPIAFDDRIQLSPALGDLDLDGSTEVVFLSLMQLIVVDINNSPHYPVKSWLMYGHDPQRTGCSDCPEDVITAAESGTTAITRVSFAPPTPNPIAGSAVFSYSIPRRAQVSLDIYDIRGRRVFTVVKEEADSGDHLVTWNGRDRNGRELASGQYLARLKVRGPGVSESLTRKITLLR